MSTSDELQVIAFTCQAQLLKCVATTPPAKTVLLDEKYIPALGHTITVMLAAAKGATSRDVQSSALDALKSFFECFTDREMLTSFFPGVVSALGQILTPTVRAKRHFRVLEKSLILLGDMLRRLLADTVLGLDATTTTPGGAASTALAIPGGRNSWLDATTSQVKLVLANVIRLRTHDKIEITQALGRLCWTVLKQSRRSLHESVSMMLQVLVSLTSGDSEMKDSIAQLLAVDDEITNTLRDNLYDWLVSLSRIMLSNDEGQKKSTISRISSAHSLLVETDVDMSMVNSIMLSTLVDSVSNAISVTRKPATITSEMPSSLTTQAITDAESSHASMTFDMALVQNHHSQETISELQYLVEQIAGSSGALPMARESFEIAMASVGDSRLVNLWLSLTILKARAPNEWQVDFDDFVDMQLSTTPEGEVCEDLYSMAITLLSQTDTLDVLDWRHQAIALEIVAFQATRLTKDFKDELVDALYPVLHLMATTNQQLRNHAITSLNTIAHSCGYANAQELLVSNVDYIVNAVGTKLNTFDLSPEAPQVLLMMIKLCGPVLLPYLDDLIENIFEALECFHGYPSLVELLFTVLKGVVEEGAKAPHLTITMDERASHVKHAITSTTVDELIHSLEAQHRTPSTDLSPDGAEREIVENKHKADQRLGDPGTGNDEEEQHETDDDQPSGIKEDAKVPLTKTYDMLKKITELTQHHLPSSSPSIRASLISLLTIALPYLSQYEDTFLPMVHTLWPVLVTRLEDKEAYVVAGTLDIIAAMCEGAGDFMSGRIEAIWPTLQRLWKLISTKPGPNGKALKSSGPLQSVKLLASTGIQKQELLPSAIGEDSLLSEVSTSLVRTSKPAGFDILSPQKDQMGDAPGATHNTYTATTTITIRTAFIHFLILLLHHVRISEAIFNEILSTMLYDALVLERRADVKEALEARNPDAVWLVLERARWAHDRQAGGEWWRQRTPHSPRAWQFLEMAV